MTLALHHSGPDSRWVIASHNAGKVREIGELLEPYALQAVSAGELNLPEPEETGDTFAANARIKAIAAMQGSGLPALADDSGLAIPALDGAPGIYSARWAGPDKDFSLAMERIRLELESHRVKPEGAAAYFICNLCLALPGGKTHHFEGRVDGTLTFPPRGTQGFGYDPIFIPAGGQLTFAEIAPADKHAISHRAHAFKLLAAFLERSV